eukprot:4348904-Pyramimonas_sp.AAC.1
MPALPRSPRLLAPTGSASSSGETAPHAWASNWPLGEITMAAQPALRSVWNFPWMQEPSVNAIVPSGTTMRLSQP